MKDAHPIADLFPMLPNDELKDLAQDIAERGLLQPIVIDGDDRILDGRNRYRACEIAGVEPQFTTYDRDDAVGYVLAVNIARRHMTKGQRAMVIAQACLISKQTVRQAGGEHGISAARISQANTVINHAPEYVAYVISGAASLDEAYEEAKQRKAEVGLAERLLVEFGAPDLAQRVIQGQLSAWQAFEAWCDREAKHKPAPPPEPAKTGTTPLLKPSNAIADKFYNEVLFPLMVKVNQSAILRQTSPEFAAHRDEVCRQHYQNVLWAHEELDKLLTWLAPGGH